MLFYELKRRIKSMKKLFLALSVVALVAFMAGPSSALVGMPDDVPGTDVILPFFLVSMPNTGKGDNTLVVLTEVSGTGGEIHWTVWDKTSVHIINDDIPYTKWDVVPISVYAILADLPDEVAKKLEVDVDGDGVNDHWMGYMTFDNSVRAADNFIAHMYQVDLANGQTAGTTIPAREHAPQATDNAWGCVTGQYKAAQNTFFGTEWIPMLGWTAFPDFTDYEVFTAFALRESENREAWRCVDWGANPEDSFQVPAWFRLLPRFYLHEPAVSQNLIFIWTSGNWGYWEAPLPKVIYACDEKENCISTQIDIPYELNVINIKTVIPKSWRAARIGGWLDITWEYEFRDKWLEDESFPWLFSGIPMAAEWLAYSYQTVDGALPSANWSSLYGVHREVGPYINPFEEP
jgi:hypothetical protein